METRRKHLKLYKQFKENDECFWCGRFVFAQVLTKKGWIGLVKHVDHKMPFVYAQSDKLDNLVVSCSLCNLFKSGKVFDGEEDVRYYLSKKWREKTYELFDVRKRI